MASTVLFIEDEPKLRDLVRAYLHREGIDVLSAGTGSEGLALATAARPDLVVLDLGLPDIPGEVLLRELRRHGQVPILILSAKASERDRIVGFEAGADDYLTKPFSPRELVLRVLAILRRGNNGTPPSPVASFGDGTLELDADRREARVRGVAVTLTPTEWGLLGALSSQPGRVYSRAELANRVRGYERQLYERTIDSHIRNLRRKVEANPQAPEIVLTVLGGGYRLGLARDRLGLARDPR